MLKTSRRFLYRCLVSLLMSCVVLLVSCGDDSPLLPSSSDDGLLTLNLMLAPPETGQQGNTQVAKLGIVTAEVEVIGVGIEEPIRVTVSLDSHQSKVTLKVPEGNNRVIRIMGRDKAGITQAVIKGYVNVIAGKTVTTTVNWQTTPVGEVIEKLIDKGYEGIEEYDAKELQAKVDSIAKENGINSIVFDTDEIANYIIKNGRNPTDINSFVLDMTPPPAPIVKDEGEESRDTTLIFSWNKVTDTSGIVGYELQISTTPDFTEVITTKPVLDVSEVAVTSEDGIGGGITYYARVRAQDGAKLWSEWSEPTDGITVNPPKTSLFVVDGAIIQSGKPAPDGLIVTVNILRGKKISATKETTTGKYGESGRYTVTFLDLVNNRAATVGDTVEVIVKDKNGKELGKNAHEVSEENIEQKKARVDVTVH